MTRKSFLFCAVVVALVGLFANLPAQASITVTDTAQFQATGLNVSVMPPAPIGPPISFTELTSAGTDVGRSFTNQWGVGQIGDPVYTVGGALIGQAIFGDAPSNTPGHVALAISTADGLRQFVAVFGIQGTVTGVAGTQLTATFTQGRVMLAEVPGGYLRDDPTTWGFNPAVPPGFAQYDLKPPEPIIPGVFNPSPGSFPAQIGFPQSDVNVSATNTSIGNMTQGLFLVLEDPAHNILDSDSNQPPPPGLVWDGNEVLVTRTQQTVVGLTENNVGGNGISVPEQVALDNIALWAFGNTFADWTGLVTPLNPFDDYIVTIMGGQVVPGAGGLDFITDQGLSGTPGLQAIPEPASVVIWGLMLTLGLAWGFRKRR